MKKFYTIEENTTNILVEKKSKFIADIFYVENKEEILKFIIQNKKKYHDARHHCYAYRIIENGKIIEQSNDDGEPSGTAGGPMLQIFQKEGMCNILVIVTRYFGGVLLGTGGLIRAYSQSLQNALEKSKKIEIVEITELIVELEYCFFDKFKYFCKKSGITIVDTKYTSDIVCKIALEYEKLKELMDFTDEKYIKVKNNHMFSKRFVKKVY